MITFNLLPWREALRKRKKQRAQHLLYFSVMLVIISALGVHHFFVDELEVLRSEIAQLTSEKEAVKTAAMPDVPTINQTNAMSALMSAANAREIKNRWQHLGADFQAQVCFNEITKTSDQYHFSGRANSLKDIAAVLQTWDLFQLLGNIHLGRIEQVGNYLEFQVTAEAAKDF